MRVGVGKLSLLSRQFAETTYARLSVRLGPPNRNKRTTATDPVDIPADVGKQRFGTGETSTDQSLPNLWKIFNKLRLGTPFHRFANRFAQVDLHSTSKNLLCVRCGKRGPQRPLFMREAHLIVGTANAGRIFRANVQNSVASTGRYAAGCYNWRVALGTGRM
jgi:hypothetical protein